MIKIGDNVEIFGKSRSHHIAGGLPIIGKLVEIDNKHYEGWHTRPYKVMFKNGNYSIYTWYEYREIKKAK
jgi:hypothetical protein